MSGKADESTVHTACPGQFGQVRFAQVANGTYPAETFWNGRDIKWQAKFMALFRAIVSDPKLQLRNPQHFKKVEGKFFEFKKNDLQARIFAFRHGNSWYLVHGLTGKKEDDLPPAEVNTAKRLMEEAMAILARQQTETHHNDHRTQQTSGKPRRSHRSLR